MTNEMRRRPSTQEPKTLETNVEHEMANKESKVKKLVVRVGTGLLMISGLAVVLLRGGHIGVGILILFSTCGLFRELVNVAHSEANAEKKIPWFRSVLYVWFFVAAFGAYTSSSMKAPMNLTLILRRNRYLPYIGPVIAIFLDSSQYHSFIGLWLYAISFVGTVLCFRVEYLAIQLRILSFTVLALSLFVIPIKMAVYNTFTGLFWFLFPILLVAINDSFAYFSGYCFGNKIIKKPFLAISPNKTWEGFLGGGIVTVIAGYYLPLLLCQSPWLTCTYDQIQLHGVDKCVPLTVFTNMVHILPPSSSSTMTSTTLSRVLFFLTPKLEIQYHGLFLGIFASTVAPFGGFAASAIKRAYGIKDFATFIPGHGGFMDRLDCQFLMALATYIHLKTLILSQNSSNQNAQGGQHGFDTPLALQNYVLDLVTSMTDDEKQTLIQALSMSLSN